MLARNRGNRGLAPQIEGTLAEARAALAGAQAEQGRMRSALAAKSSAKSMMKF